MRSVIPHCGSLNVETHPFQYDACLFPPPCLMGPVSSEIKRGDWTEYEREKKETSMPSLLWISRYSSVCLVEEQQSKRFSVLQ